MRNEKLFTYVPALISLALLFVSGSAYPGSASLDAGVRTNEPLTLDDAWKVFSTYNQNYGRIDETVAMTEEILKRDPDNLPALLFLSRVWLTYGYVKARTKGELIRAFENGRDAARKATEIEPRNADAHFFYVANLASLGETKGLFNSLFMLPEVRRELETILDLDPDNVKGLAMTGALYLYLPSILGGDLHISEVYLRRSMSLNPHISSAGLYLAVNLKRQKKYAEAIEVLKGILDDGNPDFYPDWVENRKYAYAMMKHIEREMEGEKAEKRGGSTLN